MHQTRFTGLRHYAKQYFDLAESGEPVHILRKAITDIFSMIQNAPSWKRSATQPLVLDGVSISQMILEERETG